MDDKKSTNEKRLSMDEIFKNLLSCSEQVSALERVVHVYDPKELQSGWQTVISNPKYVACPDKRERGSPRPSVKSDSSTSCSTQKRNAYKEKRKDFRQESISVKFNKYESLGVLSYDVPSWRTIVDPETCTYVKRNHPCYFNDAVTRERNRGLTFLDPGGALDQQLGSFVKRQRENNVLQSHLGDSNGTPISNGQLRANCSLESPAKPHNLSQNSVLPPSEGLIRQPLRPKDIFQPGNITVASLAKPEEIASVPGLHIFKHPKPGIHNSCIPLPRRELSPLLTSTRVVGIEKNIPRKSPRDLTLIQQPKPFPSFNKPFMPVSFQIVKPGKHARANQKLNWLPITSPTPCVPRHISVGPSDDDPEAVWARTAGLVHNPVNKAITHVKSQIPGRERIALAHKLKAGVPGKVIELPLASTGLN